MDQYYFGIDMNGKEIYDLTSDNAMQSLFDVYRDGDTGLYTVSLETIFKFDTPGENADYIETILTKFTKYMSQHDIVESYAVKMTDRLDLCHTTGRTMAEAYEKFRLIAEAFIRYYRSVD